VVAIAAIALGGLLFLGVRTDSSGGSLETLAAAATPFDRAIANGKPTLVEFYANWCTSCRAMAPELAKLKERYGDRVNFAMLNVDNAKWLPEVLSYRVDGIPHFVFLDGTGADVGQAIGEQPAAVMAANLEALAGGGTALPYAMSAGTTSGLGTADLDAADLDAAESASPQRPDDPRAHGVISPGA
jgi:thiol-disulfide isomerase/thioredoxin